MRTWWWLRRHRRHGTGPILRRTRSDVRALDRDGNATGPLLVVVWYRCDCGAIRPVRSEPASG